LTIASSCNKPRFKSLTSLPNFPLPCGRGGTGGPVYTDSSETKRVGPKAPPFNAFDDC